MPERALGVTRSVITDCPGAYPTVTTIQCVIINLYILLNAIAFYLPPYPPHGIADGVIMELYIFNQ